MVKLWLLLSRLDNGGLERVQINIAAELRADNIDVSIVAGKVTSHFSTSGDINFPIMELSPNSKLLFPYFLLKTLREEKPSHIMTTSGDLACLLIFINFFLTNKVSITVSHHLSISEPIKKAKWFKKVKLLLITYLMRLLYPFADSIVAVSNGVANDLAKRLGTERIRIKTIYNPIITEGFAARVNEEPLQKYGFHNGRPTVVYVGRISPEKRLDVALAAVEKLQAVMPLNFLVIGDGPGMAELRERVNRKKLEEYCFIAGFIENPSPLIAASDVLVLTSDFEGFGNVLVEAMGCGTQVISTNCPFGPEEILGNNQYGQLIPQNDPDSLVSAILNVLEGRFVVQAPVLKSRAMEFSSERAIREYRQVFRLDS